MAFALLSLPSEVIHNIFTKVLPPDLAALRGTCRAFHDFLKTDWLIVKEVFLDSFDDPRLERGGPSSKEEPKWEEELHRFVRTSKILGSSNVELKQAELVYVAQGIERLVKTASTGLRPSRNLGLLADHFKDDNQQNKDIFICSSSLFSWAEKDAWKDGSTGEPSQVDLASKEEGHKLSDVFVGSQEDDDDPAHEQATETGIPNASDSTPEAMRSRIAAKTHCLYGVPVLEVRRGIHNTQGKRYSLRNDTAPLHPYVRSRVYDLRQHTRHHNASFWGPLLSDGSQEVDWEKIEAIMVMLHYNMSRFARSHEFFSADSIPNWSHPFRGATPYSYVSHPVEIPLNPSIPLEAQDPYNISGTWMRVVCFLDYTELYDFNFGSSSIIPSYAPRPPLDTEEATRLITMRIQITKITQPGEDEGKALPVVHFKGTSSSVRPSWDPNANSDIREQGTVKLTPRGEVRWTTWSIFHGEERWRSEGIQVGGVQSARGVVGFWFDKDYDMHGPAGPTAFWKAHDGIEKRPSGPGSLDPGLHALHAPL